MKRMQQGFTLIELMIVVAIIGILAAVAIPAYQDYVVKSKLAKVVSTIDPIKTALSAYFQEYGNFPLNTGGDFVTYASSNVSDANAPGTDVWTSIGFQHYPTLPNELSQITYYSGGASGGTAAAALTLILTNIKATTINGQIITLSPAPGVANNGTFNNASATMAGATAMIWRYACASNADIIALKYFNNSGTLCGTQT